MPDTDELLDALREEITDLAQTHFDEFTDEAVEDAEAFLDDSKEDLKEWTTLLANGDLTQDEYRSLVEGKKDLAEMKALKRAGLAAVRVDRFRNALVDRVVGTASRLLL